MQNAIDFAGLNKLNEQESEEFRKVCMEFYRNLNMPADITLHIKKNQSNKVILNARVVTSSAVLNISESGYDSYAVLSLLLKSIERKIRSNSI